MREIAHNTLIGNVPLNSEYQNKLRRHKCKIRKLAQKKLSLKFKRRFLQQKGGFLPHLITPVMSAVGSLAGRAVATSLGF